MEFWGVEVKGGETVEVKFGDDIEMIEILSAALEMPEEGIQEAVSVGVTYSGKEVFIAELNTIEKGQQYKQIIEFLHKDFVIRHNWKNGSVHLLGIAYKKPLTKNKP